MKLNIIFDIDSCMAQPLRFEAEKTIIETEKELSEEIVADLLMTAYEYEHLIYPGFYALWKWLYQKGINIKVFSTGIKERNVELIDKFAERSFRDISKEKRPEVKVFSRNDCIDTERLSEEESRKKYQSFWFGNLKKQLTDIVVSKEELPYSLLIEDDRSYVPTGEEKNLVILPSQFEYFPHRKDDKGFQSFHKAYYACGLLQKIFNIVEERNLTLALAAEYVQATLEGEVIGPDFYYPSRKKMEYYTQGLKILQTIDSSLKFYFKSKYPR